jgi:type II secretory pathway pseudopilin PulG
MKTRCKASVVRDVGETLLELIITIAILGVTVPALIGSVLVAVDSSSQDRRIVQAQQMLTSWSETIAKANTDATYGPYTLCPAPTYYATGTFAPTPALPSGFTASVVAIDYWKQTPLPGSFQSCAADEGVRRLRLRITVNAALYPTFNVERYVLVRKPWCSTC